jgi:hypothetical protein
MIMIIIMRHEHKGGISGGKSRGGQGGKRGCWGKEQDRSLLDIYIYIHTHEGSIMKSTKYCWNKGEEEGVENKTEGELVQ